MVAVQTSRKERDNKQTLRRYRLHLLTLKERCLINSVRLDERSPSAGEGPARGRRATPHHTMTCKFHYGTLIKNNISLLVSGVYFGLSEAIECMVAGTSLKSISPTLTLIIPFIELSTVVNGSHIWYHIFLSRLRISSYSQTR
jgi:hypothetical protein